MELCASRGGNAVCFYTLLNADQCDRQSECACIKRNSQGTYASSICSRGQYCSSESYPSCIGEISHEEKCGASECVCPGTQNQICSRGQTCWIKDISYNRCFGTALNDGGICNDANKCLCKNAALAKTVVCPSGKKCLVSTNQSICAAPKRLLEDQNSFV